MKVTLNEEEIKAILIMHLNSKVFATDSPASQSQGVTEIELQIENGNYIAVASDEA